MLQSGGPVKVKKIAEKLQIGERMVRKYKDDLEQAGIYIDSIPGPNGGYSLNKLNFFNLKLTKEQFATLHMARQELLRVGDFMFLKEYDEALDRIKLALNENNSPIIADENLNMDSKPNVNLNVEKDKYIQINDAIITNRKVKIKYMSLKSGLKERVVSPYAVFMYKGFWYFIGFCELRKEIREFKLSRINEFSILDENFVKPKSFSLKEYMKNSIGIFSGEEYKIKLKIKYPMSVIVNEKVWVDNQKIEWQDDKSILFTATMQGLPEIKSWILSMGSKVEIIEPLEIKEIIKKEIREIIDLGNI